MCITRFSHRVIHMLITSTKHSTYYVYGAYPQIHKPYYYDYLLIINIYRGIKGGYHEF